MRFYTPKRRQPSVIIVSLIDILTILLIFFVVTTTFRLPQPQVVIDLPESKAGGRATMAEQTVLIHVTKEEKVFLNDRAIPPDDIGAEILALQKADPGRVVAMRADKGTPFGLILRIIDSLKSAGIKDLPALLRPQNE